MFMRNGWGKMRRRNEWKSEGKLNEEWEGDSDVYQSVLSRIFHTKKTNQPFSKYLAQEILWPRWNYFFIKAVIQMFVISVINKHGFVTRGVIFLTAYWIDEFPRGRIIERHAEFQQSLRIPRWFFSARF